MAGSRVQWIIETLSDKQLVAGDATNDSHIVRNALFELKTLIDGRVLVGSESAYKSSQREFGRMRDLKKIGVGRLYRRLRGYWSSILRPSATTKYETGKAEKKDRRGLHGRSGLMRMTHNTDRTGGRRQSIHRTRNHRMPG